MSSSYLWAIIVIVSIGNFVLRALFVEAYGRIKFPPLIERGLNYVPAAVLSAIIAPAVLMPDQQWVAVTNNAQLWAAIVAALVAWYFKSIFRTLIIGIAVYWLLLWLGLS